MYKPSNCAKLIFIHKHNIMATNNTFLHFPFFFPFWKIAKCTKYFLCMNVEN